MSNVVKLRSMDLSGLQIDWIIELHLRQLFSQTRVDVPFVRMSHYDTVRLVIGNLVNTYGPNKIDFHLRRLKIRSKIVAKYHLKDALCA